MIIVLRPVQYYYERMYYRHRGQRRETINNRYIRMMKEDPHSYYGFSI